jgi:hypothetical protein
MLFCYQAIWIIVCAVTDDDYPFIFPIVLPLLFVVLNAWSSSLFHFKQPLCDELFIAKIYLFFILCALLHYVVCCINQITTCLGIRCFVIVKKVQPKTQ